MSQIYYYKTTKDSSMYNSYVMREKCRKEERIPRAKQFIAKYGIPENAVRLDGPHICVDNGCVPKELEGQFTKGDIRYLKKRSKLNKEWAALMNEIDPNCDMFANGRSLSILDDFNIRWYAWRCCDYFVLDETIYFKTDIKMEYQDSKHINEYIEITEVEYKEKELEILKPKENIND